MIKKNGSGTGGGDDVGNSHNIVVMVEIIEKYYE
jgi:hypothetical protein